MKYCSVFKRSGRSVFYVSFWDPKRQKRVMEATPFRIDDPQGRRKATDLANEKSKEARTDKADGSPARWESWAEPYLRSRYGGLHQRKTLHRVIGAWSQWRAFLEEQEARVPRAIDYNLVLAFIAWRTAQVRSVAKTKITKNTALCDVRIMSVLMREAMRRGFCEGNPCERLGIQQDRPAEKPEIKDAEVTKIRNELKTRPEWMRICFEVAIHQGCRLSETSFPLDRVDFKRDTVRFSAKGRAGEPHVFTTMLHPDLKPTLKALLDRGDKVTCMLPVMAAKEWHFFLEDIKLPHLCFHCTRVTVVTRMARSGVPMAQAMAYVGHASTLIHKIYQRLQPADLTRAVEALKF